MLLSDSLFIQTCDTVRSVSKQLNEMKLSVDDWLTTYSSKRDYFTPTEDESIRRLQASYWQLRCAMLEVILDLRNRWYSQQGIEPELFLPGYAGSLVLLDGARFLRERFHNLKKVRRKLNEPEPTLGIPRGVYDATQKSWTSARRLWQLFDAARYYDRQQAYWSTIKSDVNAALMMEIIQSYSTRLELGFADYAEARFRFRFRQFWSFIKRDLWGASLFRIQKAIGTMAADRYLKLGHQPGLPECIKQPLLDVLEPGDILLVRKEHALTNYFLPGYWPHVAMFLGTAFDLQRLGLQSHPQVAKRWPHLESESSPSNPWVMEAMKDGVYLRSINSPLRSDSVLVLRPIASVEGRAQAIARAICHEGKEYDFSFDFTTSDRLVCTEVVYRAYDGIEGISFTLSPRAGRMTLAAEDIVKSAIKANGFKAVASYIPNQNPVRLLSESETLTILQKGI